MNLSDLLERFFRFTTDFRYTCKYALSLAPHAITVGHFEMTDNHSLDVGDSWRGAFDMWTKAFLTRCQATVIGYYAQTLDQIQKALSDKATHSIDAAEKAVLQRTARDVRSITSGCPLVPFGLSPLTARERQYLASGAVKAGRLQLASRNAGTK